MLLIHQRKSAGTSLMHTLASHFNLAIVVPAFDLSSKRYYENLERIAYSKDTICSVHLHPTKRSYEWVRSLTCPLVILLREPESAYQALTRHVGVDSGGWKGAYNGAYFFKDAKFVCQNFSINYLALHGHQQVYIATYERLMSEPEKELNRISTHYFPNSKCEGPTSLMSERVSSGSKERKGDLAWELKYLKNTKSQLLFIDEPKQTKLGVVLHFLMRAWFYVLRKVGQRLGFK